MLGTIRIWADELARLPEYSFSKPTGQCVGKTWKSRAPLAENGWMIGQYVVVDGAGALTYWFNITLLSGPRQGNEKIRFKTECCLKELR